MISILPHHHHFIEQQEDQMMECHHGAAQSKSVTHLQLALIKEYLSAHDAIIKFRQQKLLISLKSIVNRFRLTINVQDMNVAHK